MGIGGPFPGGKAQPGRDADHSPSFSAEVKNKRNLYYPLPIGACMAVAGQLCFTCIIAIQFTHCIHSPVIPSTVSLCVCVCVCVRVRVRVRVCVGMKWRAIPHVLWFGQLCQQNVWLVHCFCDSLVNNQTYKAMLGECFVSQP
jgi:hypothetical protein